MAEAIAECCRWPGNPAQLGQSGGVRPLIHYLKSSHLELRRAAAKALHQISSDKDNCLILHQHGAVMVRRLVVRKISKDISFLFSLQLLLKLVGCGDAEIQAAAAGCLGNIRACIH